MTPRKCFSRLKKDVHNFVICVPNARVMLEFQLLFLLTTVLQLGESMRAKRAIAIGLTGLMLFEASPVPQISQALTIQNAAAVRQLMSALTASTAYADTSENVGGGRSR